MNKAIIGIKQLLLIKQLNKTFIFFLLLKKNII